MARVTGETCALRVSPGFVFRVGAPKAVFVFGSEAAAFVVTVFVFSLVSDSAKKGVPVASGVTSGDGVTTSAAGVGAASTLEGK